MMRITSKGQVTIPADIREQAGLLPHTEVAFEFDGEVVKLTPVLRNAETDAALASSPICADGAMSP